MTFTISNHRLAGVPFVSSPHQGGRIEPSLIVVHDTSDRLKPDDTIGWFSDPQSKVSAHFVVARDGSVTQMVPCDLAAWHAGKSRWKGRANCNGFSIGIEIDNPGKLTRVGDYAVAWFGDKFPLAQCVELSTKAHGRGWWLRYTGAQLETVRELIQALAAAYPTITDVAAHWEIAPGRKVDTGPQFPLDDMKALLSGRWVLSWSQIREAQQRLAALGYWPGPIDGFMGPKTRSAIRTFQEQNGLAMHPDAISRPDGGLDQTTWDLLRSGNAKPMPVGTDPGKAVAAVSAQAGDAAVVKRGTEATGVIEVVNTVQSLSEHLETVQSARNTGAQISDLITWAMTPGGIRSLLVLAACIAIWIIAHRIAKRGAAAKPAPAA